jgi:hypothetical protein
MFHHLKGSSMKSFVLACTLACALLVTSALAQSSPNGQFGIGLTLGSANSGAQMTYAINPNIHVGARLGFASFSQSGESQSVLAFAPFFRYLLNTSGVTPYLHAEFAYNSAGSGGYPGNITAALLSGGGVYYRFLRNDASSTTALLLGGGVAYYWNGTFGVRAEINLLDLGLDPSYTQFAIGPARLGVDWFFGR